MYEILRQRNWRRRGLRGWPVILAGCVAVAVVGLAMVWFFLVRETGPIPRQYRKGLSITLYYPYKLPDGYTVDKQSFKREGDVLIFSINAPNGKNIAVSEASVPAGGVPQADSPVPFEIAGERKLTTAIGAAHISLWGDKYVADIATPDGTWVILNVTGFTADQAAAVTNGFTKL